MSEKAIAGNRESLKVLFMKIPYFWLCNMLLTVCRFSVLEGSDGYSLILVLRLLIAEPSLVEKQGL